MKIRIFICCLFLSFSTCAFSQIAKNETFSKEAAEVAHFGAQNKHELEVPGSLSELKNPYKIDIRTSCEMITEEVNELTHFIGPDWDSDFHVSKTLMRSQNLGDIKSPFGGTVKPFYEAEPLNKRVALLANYASVRRTFLRAQGAVLGCSTN